MENIASKSASRCLIAFSSAIITGCSSFLMNMKACIELLAAVHRILIPIENCNSIVKKAAFPVSLPVLKVQDLSAGAQVRHSSIFLSQFISVLSREMHFMRCGSTAWTTVRRSVVSEFKRKWPPSKGGLTESMNFVGAGQPTPKRWGLSGLNWGTALLLGSFNGSRIFSIGYLAVIITAKPFYLPLPGDVL